MTRAVASDGLATPYVMLHPRDGVASVDASHHGIAFLESRAGSPVVVVQRGPGVPSWRIGVPGQPRPRSRPDRRGGAALHERYDYVGRLRDAQAPRPRVALIEWTDPVFIAGHWGPEQVRRAGGIDVLGTAGAHSVTVAMDAMVAADPEIVLVAPCGYGLDAAADEARRLLAHPDWAWLVGRQLWALDANGLVSRPGPRIVDGIEAMARVFNPGCFSPVDPRHAVRVA